MPASWSDQKTATARPPTVAMVAAAARSALNTLVEEAVAGNLDVATAKAKIRQARASYRQSAGDLVPHGRRQRLRHPHKTAAATEGGAAGDAYSYYQAGFDASWELDLFGANRRGVEAARYGVDASEQELRSTLLTLVGDVASYYARHAAIRRASSSPAHGRIATADRGADPHHAFGRHGDGRRRRQGRGTGKRHGGRCSLARGQLRPSRTPAFRSDRPPAGGAERAVEARRADPGAAPAAADRHSGRHPADPAGRAHGRAAVRPIHRQGRPGRGGPLSLGQPDRQYRHLGFQGRRPRQEFHHRLVFRADAQRADLQCRAVEGGGRRRQGRARPIFHRLQGVRADGARRCRKRHRCAAPGAHPQRASLPLP